MKLNSATASELVVLTLGGAVESYKNIHPTP